jgi:sterol desaturase/sphingolipid hydroxylase (fatty acid hydroxylase superfamily)
MTQILALFVALSGLGTLLYVLEWLFRPVRSQPLWRQDSNIDVAYWLLAPLLTRTICKLLGVACAGVLLAVVGRDAGPRVGDGFGPVLQQAPWLTVLELFLLGDLIGYWTHRLFHARRLWRFHAVHHSSTRLDWLSALRVHPVNDVVARMAPAVILAALGFPLKMLVGYTVFLTFYAMLLHTNVSWSFGPLRYLLASPLFHHWHHTREHQGQNTNFAPLFPVIDIVFGTFCMPAGERPLRFGTVFTSVPGTFFGQLVFPFRWSKSTRRRPLPTGA